MQKEDSQQTNLRRLSVLSLAALLMHLIRHGTSGALCNPTRNSTSSHGSAVQQSRSLRSLSTAGYGLGNARKHEKGFSRDEKAFPAAVTAAGIDCSCAISWLCPVVREPRFAG